ncbi:hypothetical protein Bca4012_017588 [Brassica carinata]
MLAPGIALLGVEHMHECYHVLKYDIEAERLARAQVPDTSAGMASFGDAKGSTASNSVIHVKHVHGAFSTTDGADVQEKGRNGKKPQHPSLGMGKTKADNAQIN